MLKPILKEQAIVDRILRGYVTVSDVVSVTSEESLRTFLPNLAARLSGVELEMLHKSLLGKVK